MSLGLGSYGALTVDTKSDMSPGRVGVGVGGGAVGGCAGGSGGSGLSGHVAHKMIHEERQYWTSVGNRWGKGTFLGLFF